MITYEVGLSVDNQKGVVSVQDTSLETSSWEKAVQFAMDLAQQDHPDAQIEFEFCKEYD
jgi:hypothetical protein